MHDKRDKLGGHEQLTQPKSSASDPTRRLCLAQLFAEGGNCPKLVPETSANSGTHSASPCEQSETMLQIAWWFKVLQSIQYVLICRMDECFGSLCSVHSNKKCTGQCRPSIGGERSRGEYVQDGSLSAIGLYDELHSRPLPARN